MCIAEWILILIVCLFCLNNLVMCLYCYVAEKIDSRYFAKRSNNIVEGSKQPNELADSKSRKILQLLYYFFNPYFYGLMRYNLLLVGRIPSTRIRHFFYKFIYRMKISKRTVISGGCEIRSPWNISIGNSVVAVGCLLDGRQKITIGDNVVLGSFVHFWTEEHDLNDPYFAVTPVHSQPIVVEDYCWICSDSTILPGTVIKKGAVIASRACVTKNCDEYSVYGGVPAKKIGVRNKDLRYELSGKPTWHFY